MMLNKKDNPQVKPLEMFLIFFKIGLFTFGGGYVMIDIIRREFTENKKWLDTDEFLEILGITQSLPGPIAVNFAILAGYRFHRFSGAFFSLLGAILPSFIIILIIAAYLWQYGDNKTVQAAFAGIRPIVVALILSAAIKLGRGIPRQTFSLIIFLLCLGILIFFRVHPVAAIGIGALAGFLRNYYSNNLKGAR